MKRSFLLCCIIVLFAQNANSQMLGDLYTEARFSMSMPSGWITRDVNQKYLMIIGPEDSGLTPNIGFGDEDYNGPVSDFFDERIGLFPKFYRDFSLLNRSGFTTNGRVTGECITYLCTIGNVRVRQKMYAFSNRRRTSIVIITGTAPVDSGDKYDGVFDASVKTFRWIR